MLNAVKNESLIRHVTSQIRHSSVVPPPPPLLRKMLDPPLYSLPTYAYS